MKALLVVIAIIFVLWFIFSALFSGMTGGNDLGITQFLRDIVEFLVWTQA